MAFPICSRGPLVPTVPCFCDVVHIIYSFYDRIVRKQINTAISHGETLTCLRQLIWEERWGNGRVAVKALCRFTGQTDWCCVVQWQSLSVMQQAVCTGREVERTWKWWWNWCDRDTAALTWTCLAFTSTQHQTLYPASHSASHRQAL